LYIVSHFSQNFNTILNKMQNDERSEMKEKYFVLK
jgi:hypothetical protein